MTTLDPGRAANTDLRDRLSHLPSSEMLNSLLGGYSSDAVAQMAVEWAHKANAKQLSEEDVRAINAVIDAQNGGMASTPAQQYQLARVIDILHEEVPRPATLCEQLGKDEGEWHATVSNSKAMIADEVKAERERYNQQSLETEFNLRNGASTEMVLASGFNPALEAKVQERYIQVEQMTAPQQGAASVQAQTDDVVHAAAFAEGDGPPEPPDDVPETSSGPGMP